MKSFSNLKRARICSQEKCTSTLNCVRDYRGSGKPSVVQRPLGQNILFHWSQVMKKKILYMSKRRWGCLEQYLVATVRACSLPGLREVPHTWHQDETSYSRHGSWPDPMFLCSKITFLSSRDWGWGESVWRKVCEWLGSFWKLLPGLRIVLCWRWMCV